METNIPAFKGLCADLTKTPCWIELGEVRVAANPDTSDSYGPEPPEPTGAEGEDCKGHWDKRLTNFQKLMFINAFSEEKVRD